MYVLITTLWCNKDGEFPLPSKAPLREVARLRSTARRLRRRIASHRIASSRIVSHDHRAVRSSSGHRRYRSPCSLDQGSVKFDLPDRLL